MFCRLFYYISVYLILHHRLQKAHQNTPLQQYQRRTLDLKLFAHSVDGFQAALDPKIEKSIAGVVLTSPAVGVQPSHPIFLVQ